MQPSGSYRMTVRQGPVPGKVFDLVKDVATIGRDVSNDVVINDAEVSRNHGRLTAQSGGYLIEDLASTNGTFVNGQRLIGPKLLNPGDVVGLGETIVIEYSFVADAGATVVASAPPPRMMAEPPTAPPQTPERAPMMAPDPFMAPPPMIAPEPFMAPPPMMAPEPMMAPTPMMAAEPAYNAGMAAGPGPMAPPPPPLAPMAPAKPNNNRRNIGIACGCLVLLCLCVSGSYAIYAYLPAIRQALGM